MTVVIVYCLSLHVQNHIFFLVLSVSRSQLLQNSGSHNKSTLATVDDNAIERNPKNGIIYTIVCMNATLYRRRYKYMHNSFIICIAKVKYITLYLMTPLTTQYIPLHAHMKL